MFLLPIAISMAAGAWSQVLTQEGHVFSFVRKVPMSSFIAKPLYSCWICVSGQWALWFQIIFLCNAGSIDIVTIFISTIGILVTMFVSWQVSKIQAHF